MKRHFWVFHFWSRIQVEQGSIDIYDWILTWVWQINRQSSAFLVFIKAIAMLLTGRRIIVWSVAFLYYLCSPESIRCVVRIYHHYCCCYHNKIYNSSSITRAVWLPLASKISVMSGISPLSSLIMVQLSTRQYCSVVTYWWSAIPLPVDCWSEQPSVMLPLNYAMILQGLSEEGFQGFQETPFCWWVWFSQCLKVWDQYTLIDLEQS